MFVVLHIVNLILFLMYIQYEYKHKRYLSLTMIMLAAFSILYTLPLILESLFSFQFRSFYVNESNEIIYNLAVIISFYSLLVGIFLGKAFQKKEKIGEEKSNYFRTSKISLILSFFLLAISFFAAYSSLMNSGGLLSIIFSEYAGGDYLQARVLGKGSGVLGLLIWLIPVNLLFIFLSLRAYIRYKFFRTLIVSTLIFLAIASYILLTARHNLITLFLLFYYYIYFTCKKTAKRVFFVAPIIGLLVISLLQGVRVSGAEDIEISKSMTIFLESLEHKDVTHKIIAQVEEENYTYFAHVQDVFIFFIPRAFWAEKPRTSYLNNLFFPDLAKGGSEKAFGIVAEGYAALGLLGVLLLSFFVGMFFSLIQNYIYNSKNKTKALMYLAIFIPLSYISVRTGVFGKHLIGSILIFINIKLLFLLSKKGKNISYENCN